LIDLCICFEVLFLFFRGTDVVSDAVDGSGRPTLVLRPKGSSMEVSVSSFEQLGFLVEAAGSRKLLEARHCLEGGNRICLQ